MSLLDRLRAVLKPSWSDRFPAPERPWTPEYTASHEQLVRAALDDASLCRAIAGSGRLPAGYGRGFDERVIEFPWVFGKRLEGRVLDAGSTLNHEHILDRALGQATELTITTLAPETHAFPSRGISYVFGDLRELPFRDDWFDTTLSLSTLEHVGMANTVYGVDDPRSEDPDAEVARAAAELRRVTRAGGRILLTVPFGAPEDHGWFRQFDQPALERLVEAFGADQQTTAIFAYGRDGWKRSAPDQAAGLNYRDAHADPSAAPDLAAAARAVACVSLRV